MQKIAVVINTCAEFAPRAVPVLVESLRAANVCVQDIHVVVGECDAASESFDQGVAWHFRESCNIDNNGLMWLSLEADSCAAYDWVFYLHDTCLVSAGFWEGCRAIASAAAPHVHCIRLYAPYSMGMGLYRVSWLKSAAVRAVLTKLHNTDASRKVALKTDLGVLEDTVFKAFPRCRATLRNVPTRTTACVSLYGTDTPRVLEFYAIPGIFKLKSNWGQSKTMTTTL